MAVKIAPLWFAPLLLAVGSAAPAQLQLPDLGGGGLGSGGLGGGGLGGGQTGGLLGLLLPNVVSVAAPNAAGVLGYCLKNKFLGSGTGAASVIGQLTGRTGAKAEPGYVAGRKGLLQMEGNSLPLGNLKAQATTKVCDLVLRHAKTLL
ncbi:DUF2501 domain-containing protein [Sphingobium sufflavum]|uniref:DUF2501 domain-containing protein n=1 Tax=Sphingobium sufflavum TaxID=1129547 RepID=UPI001F23C32A|nr:DUF2501 domain-containing protein [Sphingobium sufflavum]MCE7795466.1 DUF2501 domain-containing protein [Sphingobium sufflavum]